MMPSLEGCWYLKYYQNYKLKLTDLIETMNFNLWKHKGIVTLEFEHFFEFEKKITLIIKLIAIVQHMSSLLKKICLELQAHKDRKCISI